MKNFITIMILSLAMIGCQAPTADPNGRTLIDPTDLIAVSDAFNDALNSADIEAASSMLSEDASWAFPNGVTVEGREAVSELLAGVSQIWTTIDQNSGDTVHLGVTGSTRMVTGRYYLAGEMQHMQMKLHLLVYHITK